MKIITLIFFVLISSCLSISKSQDSSQKTISEESSELMSECTEFMKFVLKKNPKGMMLY